MKSIVGLAAINAITALLVSSAALATGPQTNYCNTVPSKTALPSATSVGNVSAGTAVTGAFSVGNNGTSTSYAQNRESAQAMVTANKNFTSNYGNVNAASQGATKTTSAGIAYNTSTGTGSGHAQSAGFADTATRGAVDIRGVTSGFNGGGSNTHTDNVIKAGPNQGSYVSGETVSGFEAQVGYNKSHTSAAAPAGFNGGSRSATVEVSGANSGYASGANASGALEHMNAAGIANIGASGSFFGRTNLYGSTGIVTAP